MSFISSSSGVRVSPPQLSEDSLLSSRNGGMEDAPRPERGGETHVGSTPTFGTDNYAVVAERKTHRFERAAPARAYAFRSRNEVRSQSAALIKAHSSRGPG